jgi:hypothetical protein
MTAAVTNAAASDARRAAAVRRAHADGRRLLEQLLGTAVPVSDRLAGWAGALAARARVQHGEGHDLDAICADLAFPAAVKIGIASTRLLEEQPNLLSRGVCAATASGYGRGQVTVTSALLATLERLACDVIRISLRDTGRDGDRRLAATRLLDRARDAIDAADDAYAASEDVQAVATGLLEAARALSEAAALIAHA